MRFHISHKARNKLRALLAASLLTCTVGLAAQVARADAHHAEYCGFGHSGGYSHGLRGGYYWSQFVSRWSSTSNLYRTFLHVSRTGANILISYDVRAACYPG
jgi:hypothetical protein